MSFLSKNYNEKLRYFIFASITLILLSCSSVSYSAEKESIEALRHMGKAFASVAQSASPAVVCIRTEKVITPDSSQSNPYEFFLGPQRRPRGQTPRRNQEPSTSETQGSGFIISPDGYILTNNHMIEGVSKIVIELTNGQTFTAQVIGNDPDSDIAVIKIDSQDLSYLKFADSDTLEVGEWVLAIGNPLGLAHTVTAGIVSATGRTGFALNQLENYIQTDAAINFGNSGGPLINLDGEVVGINTAIAGSSGNIGIGFAIPINMAKYAYKEIIESGTVERGLLGISGLDSITPDNAAIYGLEKDAKGVIFSNVLPGSAAEKAGLTHKDVILEIDGKKVGNFLDLQTRISMLKPETKVTLTIWRDGKRNKSEVELGKRSAAAKLQTEALIETTSDMLGFKVEDMNEAMAKDYGHEGQQGVLVTEVDSASQARRYGIVKGTLIKEVNRKPVNNVLEFTEAIDDARKQGLESILLWGNINGTNYNFFLSLP